MPMFLAEVAPGSTVSMTEMKPILDNIQAQVSVSTVAAVLAGGVAASIGIVFLYWGARKLARMIMSAFRKGKLSV